jgi:hypothetical protein
MRPIRSWPLSWLFVLLAIPTLVGLASEPLGTMLFLLLLPVCVLALASVIESLVGTPEGRVLQLVMGLIGLLAVAGTVLFFAADELWNGLTAAGAAAMAVGALVVVHLER